MSQWQVSKYNPLFRDDKGRYQAYDWIDASDIEGIFNGHRLGLDEYLSVESAYIATAMHFLEESGLSSLKIVELETGYTINSQVKKHQLDKLLLQGTTLKEGREYSVDELKRICRLNLRSLIWCKLEDPGKFFIHFGYDYYMFIGSFCPCHKSLDYAKKVGLFVELRRSPYSFDFSRELHHGTG